MSVSMITAPAQRPGGLAPDEGLPSSRGRSPLAAPGEPVLLSVMIPAFNVESVLERTVTDTVDYLRRLQLTFEVVIADDGSIDRTPAVIDDLRRRFRELTAVRLSPNRGKGAAVRAAFAAARGEHVIFMDADGATSLDAIPIFLDALRHSDVVIASRHHPGSRIPVPQPPHRRLMGFIMRHLVKRVTGLKHQDTQCGFKMFRRESAEEIFRRQQIDRFAFDVELCFLARKLDYTVVELPVTWRNGPQSSVRALGDSLIVVRDVFRVRWNDLRGLYR